MISKPGSQVEVLVVPTDEERLIAQETAKILETGKTPDEKRKQISLFGNVSSTANRYLNLINHSETWPWLTFG